MEGALLEFRDVVKKFNGKAVLDSMNFSVAKGEILCIAGPSGTGKSVLLKHIVGLLAPTSGSIFVDGVDITAASDAELSSVRRRIGYLFQSGALLAWMSVAENVALPLRETTPLSDAEIDEKVRLALEAVDLADAADRYPSQISGGMQKRAGLARAVVRDCDIVLYDEPTSGLDPVTARTIDRLIVKLARSRSITSLVVTHDLRSALGYADRIMLVKGGRAVACLTPDEFRKSGDPSVREFLSAIEGDVL